MTRTFKRLGVISFFTVVLFLIFFIVCAGGDYILQIPLYLLIGWVGFLGRVGPQIHPDPATIATAIGCTVTVILGVHWFGSWIVEKWTWRWTARTVALIVLLFAAGTASLGVLHQTIWLMTSPEPLTSYMGASTRSFSRNQLKQIGLAAQSHEDSLHALPRSTFTAEGRPLHSWQTAMLPFIEQDAIHRKIRLDLPWNHSENADAIATRIKVFLHPGADEPKPGSPAVSHYAANVLTLGGDTKPRRAMEFPEGSANVIFFGEAVANPRPWADPLNWRDPRLGVGHPLGFNSPPQQKSTLFAFGDGSVRNFNAAQLARFLKDGVFDD